MILEDKLREYCAELRTLTFVIANIGAVRGRIAEVGRDCIVIEQAPILADPKAKTPARFVRLVVLPQQILQIHEVRCDYLGADEDASDFWKPKKQKLKQSAVDELEAQSQEK